jgi:NRAMP (natural resistance-associated macrophage protein)-like metal ion transporter
MLKKAFKNLGPGPLIAAAFIGPGTVTLCTLAGVNFGMALLWTLVIATLAALILQSMAVKIGIVGRKSITEAIQNEIQTPWIKFGVLSLIFFAILIGNTAYEAGNISGAVLGLETIFGSRNLNLGWFQINIFSIFIGFLSATLLWIGKYKIIERSLIGLVLIMSLSFLFTAFATQPSLTSILKGLFAFEVPNGSLLIVLGLVGTTIVPYNLFLHAALVKEKWSQSTDLPYAIKDMGIALILGGLISLSIIITAAGVEANDIESAGDLALGLEPVFGSYASYFLALGLFAAGITSSITAPLAAAYVVCGCFGWSTDLNSKHFKWIWFLVILIGMLISATGIQLIRIIKFAQITNGILLPVLALILLWLMNKQSLLGSAINKRGQNLIGLLIVVLALFLSIRTLFLVFS